MPERFDPALQRVVSAWNKAEATIKLAEQVNDAIVNPAIYELRYAGRKLVEASECRQSDPSLASNLLQDAYMDCCRSRHDAIDAASSKIISDLEISVKAIGGSIVLSHFPEWGILHEKVNEIRAKIASSREDRLARNEIYDEIEQDDLDEVVKLHRRFQKVEPIMQKASQRGRMHIFGSYSVGILGVLLGIASCVAS